MVFDAHDRAFTFFGGGCTPGIYDNMSTTVDAILVGKERRFNRRFERICSHHLVEPTACSPAAGWENRSAGSSLAPAHPASWPACGSRLWKGEAVTGA